MSQYLYQSLCISFSSNLKYVTGIYFFEFRVFDSNSNLIYIFDKKKIFVSVTN